MQKKTKQYMSKNKKKKVKGSDRVVCSIYYRYSSSKRVSQSSDILESSSVS